MPRFPPAVALALLATACTQESVIFPSEMEPGPIRFMDAGGGAPCGHPGAPIGFPLDPGECFELELFGADAEICSDGLAHPLRGGVLDVLYDDVGGPTGTLTIELLAAPCGDCAVTVSEIVRSSCACAEEIVGDHALVVGAPQSITVDTPGRMLVLPNADASYRARACRDL